MRSMPELPWSRVASFVRQHTHDIRNDLNSLDLEVALLGDIVDDPEARESLARMRSLIRESANRLKELSARFTEPRPMLGPLAASELFEIWKEQLAQLPQPLAVNWESRFTDRTLSVDANLLALALRELLKNASVFSPDAEVNALGYEDKQEALYELKEGKNAPVTPETWSGLPLQSTQRGGYGLGLWHVRQIVEAHGGQFRQHYDPKDRMLVSVVRLPLTRG
jgi:signal transduction histidine kinase